MLGGFVVEFVGRPSRERQIQIVLPGDGDVVLQQKFECPVRSEHQLILGSQTMSRNTRFEAIRRFAVRASNARSTFRRMPGASCREIRRASSIAVLLSICLS